MVYIRAALKKFDMDLFALVPTAVLVYMRGKVGKEFISLLCSAVPRELQTFVLCSKTSSHVQLVLSNHSNVELILFKDVEFQRCLNHCVPKYRVLAEEEVAQLEKKMCTTAARFPKLIASADPIARVLRLTPGQVVQVAGTEEHRVVIG